MNELKLDLYVGTKQIKAIPMMLNEAEELLGKKIGTENKEGYYYVVYNDGYGSWNPKEQFEKVYHKINGTPCTIQSDLAFTENTYVIHDENTFQSPHNYMIKNAHTDELLACIHFQEGGLFETSLNGVFIEDLINICINRLENFQKGEFKCKENAMAITKLEESLLWLLKRTTSRKQRGVLGTYVK